MSTGAGPAPAGTAAPAYGSQPSHRTWRVGAVIALVAAAAAALLADGAASGPQPAGDVTASWWVLALAFASTEAVVLHLQTRHQARSVSLSEVPLVLALFFAPPEVVLLARLAGGLPVWVVYRRQAPLKIAFNVANAAAEVTVALLVFKLLGGAAGAGEPRAWVAAIVAGAVSGAVAAFAVTGVIAAAEGVRPERTMISSALTAGPIAGLVSVGGVICVGALSWNPWMGPPLVAAVLGAMLVYRAYASLSGRHVSLERLHRFSEVVGSSGDADDVLRRILVSVQELMRAEWAQITVVASAAMDRGIAASIDSDGRLDRGPLDDPIDTDPLWAAVLISGDSVLIERHPRSRDALEHLARRKLREAVITPLRRDEVVIGAITVGNRMGDVRTFDQSDLRLLETLASTASVAWQNSRLIERLRHDALHDALTGLPNRVLLHQRTTEALHVSRGETPVVAMLLVDLDGFKEVNDTLGHQFGDLLLCEVADRFCDAAGKGGLVARLGGDEFAVLLPSAAHVSEALELGLDLQRSLELPIDLDDLSLEIAASVGIAVAAPHAREASVLLKHADVAMYDAKSSGAGVQVYSRDMDRHSLQRLGLARELRQAISDHRVEIYVQPQVVLPTGEVAGVEALARWHHAEMGWVAPAEFVAVAERSGLIRHLTSDVMRQAVEFAAALEAQGHEIGVSVNLSARNLNDTNLPTEIASLLGRHRLSAGRLILEITESTVMSDSGRHLELLTELADMGVELSIDDFGTGYSSLSHLRRLPVHEVKIDRSFVTHMNEDANDATIARAIIDLGAALDLRVVAEGVERADTLDRLCALGCDRAQGFLVGPPMPISRFPAWLERHDTLLV